MMASEAMIYLSAEYKSDLVAVTDFVANCFAQTVIKAMTP